MATRREFLSSAAILSAGCLLTSANGSALADDAPAPAPLPPSPIQFPPVAAKDVKYMLNFHRGGGNSRPENTLETFLWAWNLGAFPECDVQFTKDGIPVCFHDGKLGRILKHETDEVKNKTVHDLTWDEVRRLDVGKYKGDQFSPEYMPTLESVFAAMKGSPERILYIDEKGLSRSQAELIAQLVRAYGLQKQAFYTSGSYKKILEWNDIIPDGCGMHWMGIVWGKFSPEDLERRFEEFRANNFRGMTHLNCHIQTDLSKDDPFTPSSAKLKEMNKECADRGIVFQVISWSNADKLETYKRLLDLGITSFATDYPEVLIEAVYGGEAGLGR